MTRCIAFVALMSLGACKTIVKPNYIVRHSELGTQGDIRELRAQVPSFKPYATVSGAIAGALLGSIADYGSVEGFLAGGFVGGVFIGLPTDLLFAALGVYPGRTRIYECKGLRASHQMAPLSSLELRSLLKELRCKRVGQQF